MTKTSTTRPAVVTVLAAAGLLLAGCGGSDSSAEEASPTGSSSPSSSTEPSALNSFDPCAVFTQQQLQALGVTDPAEPFDQGIGESGCDYSADELVVTVSKAPGNDLADWKSRRDNFAVLEPNRVGSRDALRTVTKAAQGQGMCRQIMAAGDGSVSVAVQYDSDEIAGSDPCGKALEIAREIEPRMPK